MATYIEEFVAKLGFEVEGDGLKKFEERTESLKKTLGGIARVASLAAGAITGVVAVANRGTARVDAMSQAVGASTENIFALSNALKPLGFEVDNVVDLVEEMNNKFGESTGLGEQMTAVAESTRILGIEFDKIKNLAPEEQFFEVLDAALALEDTQKAVSAVDMLTGGEGNRIVGYLRAQGKGIREIIREQKELNLLTQDGIEGAKKFDAAFLKLTTVGQFLVQQFSGKLGEVLGPIIDDLVQWILVNEDLIQSELEVWAKDVGEFLVWIFETMRDLITTTLSLIEKIGGLRVAFRILLGVLSAIVAIKFALWLQATVAAVKGLVVAMGGLSGALTALKFAAVGLKWAAIFALLFLIIEDLFGFLNGKDSVIGDMSKEFENLLELASEFWADVLDVDDATFKRGLVDMADGGWGEFFRMSGLWWSELFADIWRSTVNFFTGWYNFIINKFVETVEGGKLIWTWFIDWFSSEFPALFSALQTFGGEVATFWTEIANTIVGVYTTVVGWVKDKVGSLISILPDAAKDLLGIGTEGSSEGKEAGKPPVFKAPDLGTAATSNVASGFAESVKRGGPAGSPTFNINVPTNLAVSQKGSMSPEELSRKVSKAIGTEVSKAVRNNSEGVAY